MRFSPDKSCSFYFYGFVLLHVAVWTILPSLFWHNLHLDTIEAVSWGYEWHLGYDKHPPLSAWLANGIYEIFGPQIWPFYFLSQICVGLTFVAVWHLAKALLPIEHALMSVILLEAVYYYNFTSVEFNANIALMPLWSWLALYAWKIFSDPGHMRNWIIFAVIAAFAMMAKYYILILIAAVFLLFLYDKNSWFLFKTPAPYISGAVFVLLLYPHLRWLIQNDFVTLSYARGRTASEYHPYNHFVIPIIFFCSQFFSLLAAMMVFLFSGFCKARLKIPHGKNPIFEAGSSHENWLSQIANDRKKIFLVFIGVAPLILAVLPSFLTAGKMKDMWGSVMWGWFGVGLFYFFPPQNLEIFKKRFYLSLLAVVIIAVFAYSTLLLQMHKYGDFDGKLEADMVNKTWQERYHKPLNFAIGDRWPAGNLNFFLTPRPHAFPDFRNINLSHSLFLKLIREGGVIVWNAKIYGDDLPGEYRDKISSKIEVQKPILLPFIRHKDTFYRVGWAIIVPQ